MAHARAALLPLALLAACLLCPTFGQEGVEPVVEPDVIECPSLPGYEFYPQQDADGAVTLQEVAQLDGLVSTLATLCDNTPHCNGFTSTGLLKVVPQTPTFIGLENAMECTGIYIAQERPFSGFKFTVDPATVEESARISALRQHAAIAAATKVAAKLRARGKGRVDFKAMGPADVQKAFEDAGVPLSMEDSGDNAGYNQSSVLLSLSVPSYDSRSPTTGLPPFISPVRTQGGCGSCVAFAGIAIAEAAVAAGLAKAGRGMSSNTLDFSEQHLFFCPSDTSLTGKCADGWYAGTAERIITRDNVATETNYPYTGAPSCFLARSPLQLTQGTFTSSYYTNTDDAKQHIMEWGAIMAYFTVHSDFMSFNHASGQVYRFDGSSPVIGGHQVTVVGWNDAERYWLVKNSWGSWWGVNGYFKMGYGECGFMGTAGDSMIGLKWTPSGNTSPSCGDNTCNGGETCSSCPQDCGQCAPVAPKCGDGVCNGSETCKTCQTDCGACKSTCGDGICNNGETRKSCAVDCKRRKRLDGSTAPTVDAPPSAGGRRMLLN